MSNVDKFEDLLRSSENLQEKLRAAINSYEGDKSDARAVFDAVLAPIAAEAGLPITFDEASKIASDGAEIDEADLDAVVGGSGTCFGIGNGEGSSDGGICDGIGVGWLEW